MSLRLTLWGALLVPTVVGCQKEEPVGLYVAPEDAPNTEPLVLIDSTPMQAEVTVDGEVFGRTPLMRRLPGRKDSIEVEVRGAGRSLYKARLEPNEQGNFKLKVDLRKLAGTAPDAPEPVPAPPPPTVWEPPPPTADDLRFAAGMRKLDEEKRKKEIEEMKSRFRAPPKSAGPPLWQQRLDRKEARIKACKAAHQRCFDECDRAQNEDGITDFDCKDRCRSRSCGF